MAGRPRSTASLRRRAPRRAVEATAGDSAYPVCPDCGHHTSAWMGGGCTVLVPLPRLRLPPVGLHCGSVATTARSACTGSPLGISLFVRCGVRKTPVPVGAACDGGGWVRGQTLLLSLR